MKVQQNISLKAYNTFGIDCIAAHFAVLRQASDLQEVLGQWEGGLPFVLGGGSNLLLPRRLDRLVLLNRLMGKSILERSGGKALIRCGAGENWHGFVRWCIDHGLGGIENLSLIPGTVGAAPIQNIGAYGVELSDVFHSLTAVELSTGQAHTFDKESCQFGYRDSVFKRQYKGKFCITAVVLELSTANHRLETSYGALSRSLQERGIDQPSLRELSDAVMAIRQRKLPDPSQIGNSGSFFKNPVVPVSHFRELKEQYPEMVGYSMPGGQVKVPAGWLIERAGWKGKRLGKAGSYHKQALVLVNHGGATADDIWALAERIISDVQAQFGISLEPEVNLLH